MVLELYRNLILYEGLMYFFSNGGPSRLVRVNFGVLDRKRVENHCSRPLMRATVFSSFPHGFMSSNQNAWSVPVRYRPVILILCAGAWGFLSLQSDHLTHGSKWVGHKCFRDFQMDPDSDKVALPDPCQKRF